MQQLFEWLENSSDIENDILDWETVKTNALKKEKEQMFEYVKYSYFIPSKQLEMHKELFEEWWYNQFFNQNK